MSVSITIRTVGKKLVGVFKLAGITWQTEPADTVEEIMVSAHKLELEYKRILEQRKEKTHAK